MKDVHITRDISVSLVVFRLEGPIASSGAWDAVATATVWDPDPDVQGLLSPVQQLLAAAHLQSCTVRIRGEHRPSTVVLAISELCAELERRGFERTPGSGERSYLPGPELPVQEIGLHPARHVFSLMVTAFRIDGGTSLGLSEPAWQSIAVVPGWNPGGEGADPGTAQKNLRTPIFHGRSKSSTREDALVLAATGAMQQLEWSGLLEVSSG